MVQPLPSGIAMNAGTRSLLVGLATIASLALPSCAATGRGRLGSPPIILKGPLDAKVAVCGDATFTVGAQGDEPLTYQWNRNGIPVAGEVRASMVVQGVTQADDGLAYSVTVTNGAGAVTSSDAILHVEFGAQVPSRLRF